MIGKIFENIIYFVKFTSNSEVLWIVFPLVIATIIMFIYFNRYSEEKPGWNSYVSNSLVFLFISVILLRHIYLINGEGVFNFVHYLGRFIASISLFFAGIIILLMNFQHFLPEKIANYISSPLTLNSLAYVVVLYVISDVKSNLIVFISLTLILISLLIIFYLLKFPLKKFFSYFEKMKEKDKINEISSSRKLLNEKEKEIEKEEKFIKKEKKAIKTPIKTLKKSKK